MPDAPAGEGSGATRTPVETLFEAYADRVDRRSGDMLRRVARAFAETAEAPPDRATDADPPNDAA